MAAERTIRIPILTWRWLVTELHKRGRRQQESGAFLLGKAAAADGRVDAFVCYDDLDPMALSNGIIAFHGKGFAALWDLCERKGLQVVADVHTHPTADVRQSHIDQHHPMLPVAGHIALILPRYGYTSKWSLAGVGIHVFQGHMRWKSFAYDHSDVPIRLCTW